MAYGQSRQSRCACTLPFSLHLSVLVLGIIGFFLSVLVMVYAFRAHVQADKYAAVWLLLTTIVVCVSGLQGLLVRPRSCCFNCHAVLAVISLVNLGVIGVGSLLGGSVFWVIYIVIVFVLELWVTMLRTCCTARVREDGMPEMELPIASPGAQQQAVTTVPASVQHVVGIPAPSQPYKVDPRPEDVGYANIHRGYERFQEVR